MKEEEKRNTDGDGERNETRVGMYVSEKEYFFLVGVLGYNFFF